MERRILYNRSRWEHPGLPVSGVICQYPLRGRHLSQWTSCKPLPRLISGFVSRHLRNLGIILCRHFAGYSRYHLGRCSTLL